MVVRRVDRAASNSDKITRAEELRLQLADEIVRGTLPPGAALDETDIARRFKVSRTPVREALRQLGGQRSGRRPRASRAVVARPHDRAADRHVRGDGRTEALCAGLAAERMLPAGRHRLEAIHEELRVLSYAGDPDRFHEINERFHNAIYTGSQNGYIAEMTLATRVRVQPFRRAHSAISGDWQNRTPSTTAWWWRSCVATASAPRPRCARISNWCAGNTNSTRCQCRQPPFGSRC